MTCWGGVVRGRTTSPTKGAWGAAHPHHFVYFIILHSSGYGGRAGRQAKKNKRAETPTPPFWLYYHPLKYLTLCDIIVTYQWGGVVSKLKNPVTSLEAHGSLGSSLSFTRRRSVNIVEKKPIPAYRRTLPQVYQRWLYEDYAYLWTQQKAATQRQYAALGTRFHLTGFQYWMKYQLTHLPDIVAWWKLDHNTGALALDSSRNHQDGTIFGASPATGVIDGCLLFDGINDLVAVPLNPLFDLRSQLTMMCNVRLLAAAGPGSWPAMIDKSNSYSLRILQNSRGAYGRFIIGGAGILTFRYFLTLGVSYHLAITFDNTLATNHLKYFVNGTLFQERNAPGLIDVTANPVQLGCRAGLNFLNAYEDNAMLLNRPLDAVEVARWAERRYP